jgi:hypothetical protein
MTMRNYRFTMCYADGSIRDWTQRCYGFQHANEVSEDYLAQAGELATSVTVEAV